MIYFGSEMREVNKIIIIFCFLMITQRYKFAYIEMNWRIKGYITLDERLFESRIFTMSINSIQIEFYIRPIEEI